MLGDNELIVVKFDYTGHPTHIFLRDACDSLGIPCKLSLDSLPNSVAVQAPQVELLQTTAA